MHLYQAAVKISRKGEEKTRSFYVFDPSNRGESFFAFKSLFFLPELSLRWLRGDKFAPFKELHPMNMTINPEQKEPKN